MKNNSYQTLRGNNPIISNNSINSQSLSIQNPKKISRSLTLPKSISNTSLPSSSSSSSATSSSLSQRTIPDRSQSFSVLGMGTGSSGGNNSSSSSSSYPGISGSSLGASKILQAFSSTSSSSSSSSADYEKVIGSLRTSLHQSMEEKNAMTLEIVSKERRINELERGVEVMKTELAQTKKQVQNGNNDLKVKTKEYDELVEAAKELYYEKEKVDADFEHYKKQTNTLADQRLTEVMNQFQKEKNILLKSLEKEREEKKSLEKTIETLHQKVSLLTSLVKTSISDNPQSVPKSQQQPSSLTSFSHQNNNKNTKSQAAPMMDPKKVDLSKLRFKSSGVSVVSSIAPYQPNQNKYKQQEDYDEEEETSSMTSSVASSRISQSSRLSGISGVSKSVSMRSENVLFHNPFSAKRRDELVNSKPSSQQQQLGFQKQEQKLGFRQHQHQQIQQQLVLQQQRGIKIGPLTMENVKKISSQNVPSTTNINPKTSQSIYSQVASSSRQTQQSRVPVKNPFSLQTPMPQKGRPSVPSVVSRTSSNSLFSIH